MSLQNRETLKSYFKKGQLPSEGNFNDLIDSLINKIDDGMSKTVDEGLMLSPIGESKKLLSLYRGIEDKNPIWRIEVEDNNSNLCYTNKLGDTVLAIDDSGKAGINTALPETELDVKGVVSMSGRTGNAYKGKVPADGQWHIIAESLNGCQMFEIIAGVGKKKTGKYAMAHAIAISTYGASKNRIKVTRGRYGIWNNRINFKWTGTTYNFNLEIRTRVNYGDNISICYNIQKLWHDAFMDECLTEE
jgi:hypothetical protein